MQQELFSPFLNNLEKLFKSKKDYDVIIKAGEDNDQKEIYAHSNILRCQSDYFDTAFSSNWAEKKDGKYIFKKPNVLPHIFEIIIRYFYCGQLDLNVKNGPDTLKLLVATDELGLNILSEYIQEFLIKNQKKFLQNDPIGILEVAFQHETFTMLRDYGLEAICEEPNILFGTDKILSLPAQILESLLKQDDLVLDEIEVWNNLIRWAHAQQPTVNKDPSEWTKDELILMERTLSRFIPLIRFHDITSEEYYDKVVPYDDLLPKKLKNEILKFHFVPQAKQIGSLPSRNAVNTIDSVLINSEHLAIFAGWIDKKDESLKMIPYEFNLILRASRDGNTAGAFHDKCDNKGATIIVVKIEETNQIVGGYNPLDWEGSDICKNTQDSFIFIFDNHRDINTGRIGRVTDASHALVCSNRWGPIFGNGHDLSMNCVGKWVSRGSSTYSYLGIPYDFANDDYEVFQVVKK
ncbi:hypothetical protein GLOIN_2v1784502 [Rhizophagus irregularis DAOM 181602=DAOM 197198]|uniref:Kelch-like protein 17 n=3 Tax=Rhizophagus irregularis TaxID=588596 RepID=A0A015LFR0_RHIIW|nr:hypothetical protein GLOIN_2v1784502 [Rhizophagus irregularis DAOM 181602=DAOM 197198]EXX71411.1 hypothetical protein RirG_078810 [Rhizophagus irregularis DAOM 197198w]POG63078.1 hypothetical protein GLOIN_2v1784502 [Rhizophagus irregularis DAOM 181602=DAOM 197198]|eukprot:XP_025169944.1 hypothetical protein GLOIN_2v1784502 [Rhizophagus irregularis DAOM 181602=DAOM 197198]